MKKISPQNKNIVGMKLKNIEGKYIIFGKKGQFDRVQFYGS